MSNLETATEYEAREVGFQAQLLDSANHGRQTQLTLVRKDESGKSYEVSSDIYRGERLDGFIFDSIIEGHSEIAERLDFVVQRGDYSPPKEVRVLKQDSLQSNYVVLVKP